MEGSSPEAWRTKGREIEVVPDGRIFAVDLGPRGHAKIPVLVLHGFPTSSWDFDAAANIVAKDRRVVLFDFLGFGFSDKPHDAGYSLFEQAEIAIAIARQHGLSRVHVWAHDMGTSVTTELLARRERKLLPFDIASVVLMNGSVHIDMASLTIGQRLLKSPVGDLFARAATKRVFVAQMKRIFAKPPKDEELDGMWSLMTRADGQLRMPQVIRYIEERSRFRRRWIGALERLDLPLLVAWGAKDPVARLAIGEKLARDTAGAEMITWDDLGHYPQVEDPARVASTIDRFFARVEG